MPSMEPLSPETIETALQDLPKWTFKDNAIVRISQFPAFLTAIDFINAVAQIAEEQDHHPDILVQYRRVEIRYWTHRAKGVTQLDFEGAKAVEALIPKYKEGL